jgi:hypothetical protein
MSQRAASGSSSSRRANSSLTFKAALEAQERVLLQEIAELDEARFWF